MKIVNTAKFEGFNLYNLSKSKLGFFEPILSKLLALMTAAVKLQTHPTAIHYIIDNPIQSQLNRISEIILRWHSSRDAFHRRSTSTPLYLYTVETHPRKLDQHVHIMVIVDTANFTDACSLRDRLADVSQTRKVKLARRKITCLQPIVNHQTGEIFTDENHGIRRKGSTLFHRLNSEFDDAFLRFSYIAKRFSKSDQVKWSASRVDKRLSQIDPHQKANQFKEDKAPSSNVTDYSKYPAISTNP